MMTEQEKRCDFCGQKIQSYFYNVEFVYINLENKQEQSFKHFVCSKFCFINQIAKDIKSQLHFNSFAMQWMEKFFDLEYFVNEGIKEFLAANELAFKSLKISRIPS